MADLIVYLPDHGYAEDTPVYISWLDANYYTDDVDTDSFMLVTESGGSTRVQFSTSVTSGFIREFDDSAGTTAISNLWHLEGETVMVTSGGSVVATETVSGGSITLSSDVYTYQVGLPYAFSARTMRLEVPSSPTVQSRIKKINEVSIRHLKTSAGVGGQEFREEEGSDTLTKFTSDLNTTFSTASKDVSVPVKGGSSSEGYVVTESTGPQPMTILSIVISFDVKENR